MGECVPEWLDRGGLIVDHRPQNRVRIIRQREKPILGFKLDGLLKGEILPDAPRGKLRQHLVQHVDEREVGVDILLKGSLKLGDKLGHGSEV